MPSAHGAHIKYMWRLQADAIMSQANPVSGVSYPVLAAAEDGMILGVSVYVQWTVQPTPLDIIATIDGSPITFSVANPITLTSYVPRFGDSGSIVNQVLIMEVLRRGGFILKGQSVEVAARITGGTVQILECRVKWARLLPT